MLKENCWNRLFHKNKLKKQSEEYHKSKIMISLYKDLKDDLKKANNLCELMNVHKFAWKYGYRNNNLGPCRDGIFRTSNIASMTDEDVYLGNIYGLNTKNIRYWNKHIDDKYGINGFGLNPDIKLYDLILGQYKELLNSNISELYYKAYTFVNKFESINKIKCPIEYEN